MRNVWLMGLSLFLHRFTYKENSLLRLDVSLWPMSIISDCFCASECVSWQPALFGAAMRRSLFRRLSSPIIKLTLRKQKAASALAPSNKAALDPRIAARSKTMEALWTRTQLPQWLFWQISVYTNTGFKRWKITDFLQFSPHFILFLDVHVKNSVVNIWCGQSNGWMKKCFLICEPEAWSNSMTCIDCDCNTFPDILDNINYEYKDWISASSQSFMNSSRHIQETRPTDNRLQPDSVQAAGETKDVYN